MSKFHVGDKVRILDGSKIKNYAGFWVDDMAKHIGEVYTIKLVKDFTNPARVGYRMDRSAYIWDERGLELVTAKPKFKVGDKVIGNKAASGRYGYTKEGWIGTVTKVFETPKHAEDFRAIGPCGDGNQEFGLESKYFDLYTENQKIVITTDGKTTTAGLYDGKQRIKEAKAICAPTDTFDFNYGASLALDRLTGFVRGTVDQTLEEKSDWDKFIAEKIAFQMTDDKFDAFLAEVEKRFPTLRWGGGEKPTDWKPSYGSSCYFRVVDGELLWGSGSPSVEVVPWVNDGLLNCRIRIIDGRDNCCGFESGKIYTIKDGEIFGGDFFGLPTTGKLKDLDDLKYYFAPDAEKNSLSHSGGLSHFSARGVEYKVLPDTLDWNKFAHGNLEVRVNKNNFDEFMKQCKAKKFAWADGEECNPWKDFESLSKFDRAFVMAIGAVPGKYVWITFNAEDDSLKWRSKHDEDVDEYEFI